MSQSIPNDATEQLEMLLNLLAFGRPDIRRGEIGKPVTEPTRVYRIELPNGCGPFNSQLPEARDIYEELVKPEPGWPGHLLITTPSMRREQMGVTEDAFRKAHGHAAYGCRDLRSLATWFPHPARQYLAKFSAQIIIYEIQPGDYLLDLSESVGEVVFNKATAKPVETLPVTAPIEKEAGL